MIDEAPEAGTGSEARLLRRGERSSGPATAPSLYKRVPNELETEWVRSARLTRAGGAGASDRQAPAAAGPGADDLDEPLTANVGVDAGGGQSSGLLRGRGLQVSFSGFPVPDGPLPYVIVLKQGVLTATVPPGLDMVPLPGGGVFPTEVLAPTISVGSTVQRE
jgi:hypothetical protein